MKENTKTIFLLVLVFGISFLAGLFKTEREAHKNALLQHEAWLAEHNKEHQGKTLVSAEVLTYLCSVDSIEKTMIRNNRLMCERLNGDLLIASPETTHHNMDTE